MDSEMDTTEKVSNLRQKKGWNEQARDYPLNPDISRIVCLTMSRVTN